MTVTLYSLTPPTTHTSRYLLRATPLNGPRTTPLPNLPNEYIPLSIRSHPAKLKAWEQGATYEQAQAAAQTLDDIDDWYSQTIEDDGFLERLDRSAESVRFP